VETGGTDARGTSVKLKPGMLILLVSLMIYLIIWALLELAGYFDFKIGK